MSYTHPTKTELVFIEEYHNFSLLGQTCHESIYRVIRRLKQGLRVIDVYRQYKRNKSKCGRKRIELPPDEKKYIREKSEQRMDT